MIILVAVTIASFVMFIRSMLIMVGLYKSPVLRSLEEYGPEEKPFVPGLAVLLWGGVVVVSASLWATSLSSLSFTLSFLGIFLLILAGAGYNYSDKAARYYWKFLNFPRWYHELIGRTTRYERRRIAYMWLMLPQRLRVTYNSSDKLFFIWADFVIMGTIREEELVPSQAESVSWPIEGKVMYITNAKKKGHEEPS